MQSSSESTSRSPTPDTRVWMREPPSSSWVTSSPVTAFVRCGPASAIEPRPLTIGTKSASPGMYAVPAAQGPISAATCGTTPLITTSSRNRWPEPANSEPGRLLDARAGRVEQPDHRDALGERELAQARDLQLAGHAHRAGHDREVVGGHGHEPAVDLAVAGDHAVRRRLLALHRPLREVRPSVDAELGERALVDQQRQPLARGELVLLVLAGDLLLAAAELRLLAPLVQLLDERAQRRAGHERVRRARARSLSAPRGGRGTAPARASPSPSPRSAPPRARAPRTR